MRYLLDSHVLLWWATSDRVLSPMAAEIISSPHSEILVSVVSVWDLGLKDPEVNSRLQTIFCNYSKRIDSQRSRSLSIMLKPHSRFLRCISILSTAC
jgi:PIN domain nuclease of toxin-antitoxin system